MIQKAVIIFPILTILTSIFASLHLALEYSRLQNVTGKYKETMGRYFADAIKEDKRPFYFEWLWEWKIGWVVSIAFLFFVPISILNLYLLLNLISQQ